MLCILCNGIILSKSLKYCSQRCSKNYLKRAYRKRNCVLISDYNRRYKKACSHRPIDTSKKKELIEERGSVCQRCGSVDELNVHHIKPLISDGDNSKSNLMVLCFACHMKWEKRMYGYWDRKFIEPTKIKSAIRIQKKVDFNWWKNPYLRQNKIDDLIS